MDYVELARVFNPNRDKPVIVFGSGYGGMIATLLRKRHPDIFTGAVVSSAPITYFDGQTDPNKFTEIVSEVIKK